jgi:hypothetical protein
MEIDGAFAFFWALLLFAEVFLGFCVDEYD